MKFEAPELEVITFGKEDVIRTSSGIVTEEDDIFGNGIDTIDNYINHK